MALPGFFPMRMTVCFLFGALCIGSLVGCAGLKPETTQTPTSADGGGGMGGGMGRGSEAGAPMGSTVIAAPRNANLKVAQDGDPDVKASSITAAQVMAPADGWLVARSATSPGGVLGRTRVHRGENSAVVIKLSNPDSTQVRVALHIDRGAKGSFEFDPTGKRRRPDSPVYAAGLPIESDVTLSEFGIDSIAHAAIIQAADQRIESGVLTVNYLLLPEASWVVVNQVGDDGLPGRQIGLINRQAGESQQLRIPLTVAAPTGGLVITVFADRGKPGRFEYSAKQPFSSPDRPLVSAGVVLSQQVVAK